MSADKSDEHLAWERHLGKVLDDVNAMEERFRGEPPHPPPGSALYGDEDDRFGGLSVFGDAWYRMAVSWEHLDFCLSSMRSTRNIWPTANQTVLRSSVNAAAHAVWILSPKRRQERQLRALRVECEDIIIRRNLLKAAVAVVGELDADDQRALADIEATLAQIAAHAQHLGAGDVDPEKWRPNATDIVIAAGKAADPDDPRKQSTLIWLWRLSSSAAHGTRTLAMLRLQRQPPETTATWAINTAKLEDDIGPLAVATHDLLSHAFGFLEQRSISRHAP
jgi:hypothetical protein